ncbi:nitrate- and nitrite sensing domain-containing protein [Plantactinospora sp. GCM10030261]|uniref:sensor histidine kinase n=1 Tax=Plantactinospora sp. GCM10030261 TaxID=3273420 RepID=UPI00361F3209
MLGRLRIRGKLALLMVIPLLSMVALTVPVVVDRVAAAARAGDIAQSVRIANRVGTLVQDLQQERLLSVSYLLGAVDRGQLVRKSATVDDRVADVRAQFAGELSTRVQAALDEVRKLTDLRVQVLNRKATPDQVLAAFGPIDMALIDSLRLQYDVDTRTTAGRQVLALDALLRTDEGVSTAATLVLLLLATRSSEVSNAYMGTLAALQVDNQRFRSLATPEQYQLALLEEAAVAARTTRDFVTAGAVDPLKALDGIDPEKLFASVASMITLGQFVEKKVAADVIAEVTGEQRRALTAAYLVGGAALLILALVVALNALVARAVARPLSRLTRSADRVARLAEAELTRVADDESESVNALRLDPVDVRGEDEVGELARAFDRVQGTATRLVERQVLGRRNVAQMFGHVGRRTQNLVGRQLALIDRLEQRETDPGRLQHLYRLDHVTSRLRRSASSLVVLSGATGADEHVAPTSLANVVRLALGEIEDYPRVDVRVVPDIMVAPGVIGDLVLALAELMENATAFSPPHTRVTVVGDRVAGGARLTLTDHGIGMTEERIDEENARLTRRERLDLAPTEVLGLFVVGRLARRHGWRVALSPTPGGGVTVVLELAARLLASARPEPPTLTFDRPLSGDLGAIRAASTAVPPAASIEAPVGAALPAGAGTAAGATAAAGPPAGDAGKATAGVVTAGTADAGAGTAPGRQPTRPGMGAVTDRFGVSSELLDRAIRSLEGQPWNAFAAVAADAGVPIAGGSPEPATHPEPATVPAGAAATVPAGAAAGAASARGTASVPAGRPALRQRVPGSHLPNTGDRAGARPTDGPQKPAQTGSADREEAPDPIAARALLEEFEAGVRRAQEVVRRQSTPDDPAAPGAGLAPSEAGPQAPDGRPADRAAAPVNGTAPAGPTPANGAPGRLTRRVPGSSLDTDAVPRVARTTGSTPPADPDEVRHLISQFEDGVSRALTEIRSAHDEEGSPR